MSDINAMVKGYAIEYQSTGDSTDIHGFNKRLSYPVAVTEVEGYLVRDDGGFIHPSRQYVEQLLRQKQDAQKALLQEALTGMENLQNG